MVNVDQAIVARLKKGEHSFEILVDCDHALELKAGKDVAFTDVVATDDIFKDVKKGEKASEHEIQAAFNTTNAQEVAIQIIKQGEIQLTQKHKEKVREEVRKQVAYLIHRNGVDPQTGLPHPVERIENAMNEAKVNIREHESAEQQVDPILKEIKRVLPIKCEVVAITLKIPAQYAGQAMGTIKKQKVVKTEWQNDGSLYAIVEVPAGIQEHFFDAINKVTHGEMESSIERKEA